MSTVTNIGFCKAKMSSAGWKLFCEHRKADSRAPFDPAQCADDETILLSRIEVRQYQYGQGQK